MGFILDANGTDGSDPALVDRVYTDGTRVPLLEPEPQPDQIETDARAARLQTVDIEGISTLAQAKLVLRILNRRLLFVEAALDRYLNRQGPIESLRLQR